MTPKRPRLSFGSKAFIALGILRARLFGSSIPLLVGWSVTDRCQLRCKYCGLCGDGKNDLPTERILEILGQLYKSGCRRIQFTGGEPLLREDMGQILRACQDRGIYTSISSNGRLVPDRLSDLAHAGQVNLSVDGPPEVQDDVRGAGTFHGVKRAADLLQKNGIPLRFNAVLHARNLDQIDFLLGLAAAYRTLITFQPVTSEVLGTEADNPLTPETEDYRRAVDKLIEAHGKNAPVGNSLPGLQHIRNWPAPSPIPCVGGRIFMRIEAYGGLVNCQRRGAVYDAKLDAGDIRAGLKAVKNIGCTQCWSAPVVEASFVMRGNLASIFHLNRTM